jgi:hypothetical protein
MKLCAKKIKKSDTDGLDWYDSVDDNASPDDVFWEEMERQRMQNQIVTESGFVMDPFAAMGASSTGSSSSSSSSTNVQASSSNPSMSKTSSYQPSSFQQRPPSMEEQKSAEATLQEYTMFMVSDNWLDEDLIELMAEDDEDQRNQSMMEALSPQEQAELLEQQLEDMEDGVGTNPFWMGGNEPWDLWQENNVPQDDNNQNLFQVDPNKGKFVPSIL